ncbi:MAG: hypothetical protein ACJ8EE_00265 [Bradyrhizobium sp.]
MPNTTIEGRLPYRNSVRPRMPLFPSMLKGVFASIVSSLHSSRRLQARRFIRQHRHLITPAAPSDDYPQARLGGREHVNERPSPARSARFPVVSEAALMATIGIAFLILHVLAATALQHVPAGATAPPQQEARPSSYD